MVALTIAMLRRALINPMTFEYVFPALVAVLAARTFKTVFDSFPIKQSTDTINGDVQYGWCRRQAQCNNP
jgi:hypothetical protein